MLGTIAALALILIGVGAVWAWNQGQKPGGSHSRVVRRVVSVMSTVNALSPTLTPTPVPTPTPTLGEIARQIFTVTNAERKAHGAPPVAWDNELADVAQWRAEDMVKRHYYSHYDPVTGRLLVAEKVHGRVAENIDVAYQPLVGGQYVASSQYFVTSWMHSPGHRRNMLNPSWGKIGVGVACGDGRCYAVQVFAP